MTEAVQMYYSGSIKRQNDSTLKIDEAQKRTSLCQEMNDSSDSPVDYRKSSLSSANQFQASGNQFPSSGNYVSSIEPDLKNNNSTRIKLSLTSENKGFTSTSPNHSQLSSSNLSRNEFCLNNVVLNKLKLVNTSDADFGINRSTLKEFNSICSNANNSVTNEFKSKTLAPRDLEKESPNVDYEGQRSPSGENEIVDNPFVNQCRIRIHNETVVASRLDGHNFSSTSKVTFYKCYICLEGSRQIFSSLPQLIQHLVSHYQADDLSEYSRRGSDRRADSDLHIFHGDKTFSRSVSSDYYTELNVSDSPHSPLSVSKEKLASSSFDNILLSKYRYDKNSATYPSPDSRSSQSGINELDVDIERHSKEQRESAQSSIASPISNSSSIDSTDSFQKSNHKFPESRPSCNQYNWAGSLPSNSIIPTSENAVSSQSSPVLPSLSSDNNNQSWNSQYGKLKRKFSDVSSSGTPENLSVQPEQGHENSDSDDLSIGDDSEPHQKHLSSKPKCADGFASHRNSKAADDDTIKRSRDEIKSSESQYGQNYEKSEMNNNKKEGKVYNERDNIANTDEPCSERSLEKFNPATALAMPSFHIPPGGFEGMHRAGQFGLPFGPLLLPPNVAQSFIGNQQMMSPLMSPTSGFLSNPLAYYAHLSSSIFALNQSLIPQLSHQTKQQDKGKDHPNKSGENTDGVSGPQRNGPQINHCGQAWAQPPPSSSTSGASVASNGVAKCSSLSRTHSRLDVVRHPIKRDLSCRSIVMPDGRTVYRCEYCKKDFCTMSDVNRHMDFHEGFPDIRPYKCKYCSYYARTNSQLKVHMMRHQGIREFMCHLCSYKGVTQSDLNRHTKSQIHRMKAKNECRVCHEGFVSSVNLDQHYREKHGINNTHAGVLVA